MDTQDLFGSPVARRCERAAAELRAGRPVLVSEGARSIAVLALDSAEEDVYDAFARVAEGTHGLVLTAERAGVLGLDAVAALTPLRGVSFQEATALGYGQDPVAPKRTERLSSLHAEAIQLSRLALLLPALACAEIDPASDIFADCPEIRVGDVETGRQTDGRRFAIVSRAPVPLRGVENAEFVVFRGGFAQRDQVAIVVGSFDPAGVVPVRVHSSCLTGDLFGSLKCDCGDQLRNGLATLEARGGGVLVYLDQEGRGTGIASKMRAYSLQCDGLDTVDADAMLGYPADGRRYEAAVAMLEGLGIRRIELVTNNPRKIELLRASGIDVVGRAAVYGEVTPQNRAYLRTKAVRAGHLIDVADLAGKA